MIGLMTPFRVNNYGTKLQAYALQKYIESLGYETEIVDYDPMKEPVTAGNLCRKCFYRAIRDLYADHRKVPPGPDGVELGRECRRYAIEAFDKKYLHLSRKASTWDELVSYTQRYEAVLSGSDQVFNPVNLGAKSYFLEWVHDDVRKIAISPSFGVERLPVGLRNLYARKLKRFDALSVREESGRRLMNRLGFHSAVRTLDPTFLVERAGWHALADSVAAPVNSGYVLGYFLGEQLLGRQVLSMLAKGRKIVLIPHIKGFVPADEAVRGEKLYDVGVPGFLNLVRGADCVITDSFHAAAFSVMFHRPFFSVARHGKSRHSTNARMEDFLSMLGLEDRLINDIAEADLYHEIDYQSVEEILLREKKQTQKYIFESLRDVK